MYHSTVSTKAVSVPELLKLASSSLGPSRHILHTGVSRSPQHLKHHKWLIRKGTVEFIYNIVDIQEVVKRRLFK